MSRSFIIAGSICLLAGSLALGVALPRDQGGVTYIDLEPKVNGKLKECFGGPMARNTLSELPEGEQKFGGVKFKIGKRLIQLTGKEERGRPAKVTGIRVDRPFARLYILHAAGRCQQTPEGTTIGHYTIHYQDKTREEIPIVHGKDVRDWWVYPRDGNVSRGKVVWQGNNPAANSYGAGIRLYLTTWTNPHPKKKVVRIDFSSTKTTLAAPFCVAMTVDGK